MNAPSPLLGFNNNVRHKGRVFHIQTEDSGIRHPHIITHLFADGGRILKTTKTSYAEHIGQERLAELVADGVLLATPAGSTAYNLSVQGPIIPVGSPLLALTPISPFRPRRWRGALLPDRAHVTVEVREPAKRPVAAVADHDEVRSVRSVEISMDHKTSMHMLFDPGHNLDERILREQFGY